METQEAILKRCSLKTHVSEKPVEPEKVTAILQAACLAPSARNTQVWRFVVVQGKEKVGKLIDSAFFGLNAVLKKAPAIIIVCTRPEDDVIIDGKEYYLFDVGLAVENLLLAATDLGLVTHLIASFKEAEAKRILHIPDDFRVVIATPLAYPFETSYEEAAQERLTQRTRKNLREVAYLNEWGNPWS